MSLQYNQYINTAITDLECNNGTIGLLVKIHLLSATFILSLDASPNSYITTNIFPSVYVLCSYMCDSSEQQQFGHGGEGTTIMSNAQPYVHMLLGSHFLSILNTTNTLTQHCLISMEPLDCWHAHKLVQRLITIYE